MVASPVNLMWVSVSPSVRVGQQHPLFDGGVMVKRDNIWMALHTGSGGSGILAKIGFLLSFSSWAKMFLGEFIFVDNSFSKTLIP